MYDCANTLLPAGVTSFTVASRNGYTHELPQAVPALPELEPVADQIHRLLDPILIKVNGRNKAESFVQNLKKNFEQARGLAEGHVPRDAKPTGYPAAEFRPRTGVSCTAVPVRCLPE